MKTKTIGLYLIFLGILSGLGCFFYNYSVSEISLLTTILSSAMFLIGINLGISLRFINSEEAKRKKAANWILGIGLFLVIFASFGKYFLHWYGSAVEMIIGLSILLFAYGPLLTKIRLLKWSPYASSYKTALLLSLTDFFSITFIFLGVLFKVQHWPGAIILFYSGITFLLISIKFWNTIFKKEVVLRKLAEERLEIKNQLVEEKSREILDSINYAQRIQKSILPPLLEITKALPQSFILYKPKDIVSGDFYWFSQIENKIMVAAADCTGHGVPGAFMSTIGSEKLNEAITKSTDVSEILHLVNISMKKVLRQTNQQDSTHDGMDIALVSFNKETTEMEYAGANRPLWIVRNGALIETKANKVAIGGFTDDEQQFSKHKIDLCKGDIVYIFTDGLADQFSPEDKKLMTKRFKEIILSICTLPVEEQQKKLETFIDNWKGTMEQTDDILVIGIRV